MSEKTDQRIRESAMLALSYGAGNNIQAKEMALREIFALVSDVDVTCEHGTAMDVHCCNCHSGFIFDLKHECPPATVTDVEQAKAELRAYVCREFGVEDHDDDWLMPQLDAFAAAARAEGRAEAQQEIDKLKAEMARLTEVWLASPEAAKRFDGYRELGAKCAELEGEVTRLSSLLAQREQAQEWQAKITFTLEYDGTVTRELFGDATGLERLHRIVPPAPQEPTA